jgi:hypothetical protein
MAETKGKVVDTIHLPGNGVVLWSIELPDGKQHTLFWQEKDFGPSWRLRGEMTPERIEYFNSLMIGKEIPVDIGGAGPVTKNEPDQ